MLNPKTKDFVSHIKIYIFRGIIASIPLALSIAVIIFIYVFIDKRVAGVIYKTIGFAIPGLGIILALIFFYFLGLLASNVMGKRLFKVIENILSRIPIVKAIYQVGTQISSTLSLPEKQIFKRVVLIDAFNSGVLAIGFVTGSIIQDNQEEILKIFIPSVPNPTTGFLLLANNNKVIDPKWTVEEGLKLVISGGIIGPTKVSVWK